MEALSLEQITAAVAGELRAGDSRLRATGLSTDSRHIRRGDVFFAIQGDRYDGHDYLESAVTSGAACLVVQAGRELPAGLGCGIVVVKNTRCALGMLAAKYRRKFKLPVIAVGGSNGKTSTKELVASVLRETREVLWSEASFNNDIGVPLTLLRLEQRHQVAVLEVGTNHPGELAPLVRMAEPEYGVITSIGREHLEFFNDLQGVIHEEGWLAELLPADGQLILNGDTEGAEQFKKRTRARVVTIGEGEHNEWRLSDVRLQETGMTFHVDCPVEAAAGDYRIELLGRHQALNALFAIYLGTEMGMEKTMIQRGLLNCKPAKMRLQLWDLKGVRVLDDAYNANTDSVLAALRTLVELPCKGRRVALLGDMAELGHHSEAAHEEIGRKAAEFGVAQLFAVGRMAAVVARGARCAGLNRVLEFAELEAAAAAVKSFVRPGDLLLLKASRSSRLERVSAMLQSAEAGKEN